MMVGEVYEFVNRTTGASTEYELVFIGEDGNSPHRLRNMLTGREARVWKLDPPHPRHSGWRRKS